MHLENYILIFFYFKMSLFRGMERRIVQLHVVLAQVFLVYVSAESLGPPKGARGTIGKYYIYFKSQNIFSRIKNHSFSNLKHLHTEFKP